MEQKPARKLFWILLAVLAITALLALFFRSAWGDTLLYKALFHLEQVLDNGTSLRASILAHGPLAPLLFMILQVLQVVMAPVPGEASGFLGGYLFGAWPGFLFSSIGLTFGSATAFALGRIFGDAFKIRIKETVTYQKFNHLVYKSDFVIPFVLFLLPGFPKDILSYILGLSLMPFRAFLFIAAIARMPGTLMLSFQGAHVYEKDFSNLLILIIASLAVALPCIIFHKQIMTRLNLYNLENNSTHSGGNSKSSSEN